MMEEPYELPKGWVWTTVGEIFEVNYGKGLVKEKRNESGDFLVYGSGGSVGKHNAAITSGPTIIIGRKGSVGEISLSNDKCWPIDTTYYIDHFPVNLPMQYWFYQLEFLQLGQQETSTAIPGLNRNDIYKTKIPLPPLPEQHRIVAKLEALQEQVNTSKDHLAMVPPLIKRFRQSVLAAACSGRLTEDWRREHPDVEPASELLKHIREERIRKYEEECRKAKAEGKKKPKKPTNLEVHEADTESLPELPEGWMWTDIFAVSTNHDGKRIPVKDKDRQKMKGEFPYYGASGIIDYVTGYLFDGDYLLIGEDGANLVSRSTPIAFKASGKFWVNNHAHVIEIEGGIPIELIEGYINGIDLIPYITGSAQPKLTQKKLNTIPIPLPPLYEQHVIVERIEKLFHFAEEVEKRVSKTTTLIDHLTQSIFSKAFRGELVPQDPNDVPASILLERIKKERAKKEKEKKAQKRKSKTLLDFN
jgi:type I restriction enzyme S subunit